MDTVLLIKTELASFRQDFRREFNDFLATLQLEQDRASQEQRDLLQDFLARHYQMNAKSQPPSPMWHLNATQDDEIIEVDAEIVPKLWKNHAEPPLIVETPHVATAPSDAFAKSGRSATPECTSRFFSDGERPGFAGIDRRGVSMADVMKNADDEEHFYKGTGIAQIIARSHAFQSITLFIIVLNGIYLGVALEYNPEEFLWKSDWLFILAENFFSSYYVCEWVIRFLAFRRKQDCVRGRWFKFDTLLVIACVVETWLTGLLYITSVSSQHIPMAPIRLFRLLRLGRLVRLMRGQPELITITRGLRTAFRGCLATMAMIFLANFAGSILLHTIVKDERELNDFFHSLRQTMWTLFLDGTLMGEVNEVYNALTSCYSVAGVLGLLTFFVYQCITAFMLLNLLTGVLCDVVVRVAAEETDIRAIDVLQKTILSLLVQYDEDDNGAITGPELMHVLNNSQAVSALRDLGIDLNYVQEFVEIMLIKEGVEMPIPQCMQMILACRGDQPATVSSTAFAARLTHVYLETLLTRVDGRISKHATAEI